MQDIRGRWLVGVSSGPDSMALLDMCLKKHMDVMAAHVNYHHRPEADEEEAYVRSFCREHGIACLIRNEPFVSEDNFEADARNWRYSFFCECVRKYHLEGVLIAHQEDDLLETYFMQREKNLVPAWYGLKESNEWHGMKVVRPLLSCTKKELQNYCEKNQIRYYVDATNADETITRNRIRHQKVEKMNRSERDVILQEIHALNLHKTEMEQKADACIHSGRVSLEEYRSLSEDERDTVLRRLMEKDRSDHHLSLAFIQEIDGILLKKNDFEIPVRDQNLVQNNGYFFMQKPYEPYCDVYHTLSEMKQVKKQRYRITEGKPGVYACSVKKEDFPLVIRNFEEGDSIAMRFGRKPVHRFFIDRHIPLYLRSTWPVVVNRQGQVILVPGLGCDEAHYTVTPDFNVIEYSLPEGEN